MKLDEILTFSVFLLLLLSAHGQSISNQQKPNVLFIVIDDLRTSLGAYDFPTLKTPNIDQFASHSVKFENAHAQQAVCGPSRTSFLTSRRPDTTRLYDFNSYWRKAAGNFTILPQHFKQNGYFTYSIGKVFHRGIASGHNRDFPYSWSKPAYIPSTKKYKMEPVCPGADGQGHVNLLCAVNVTTQPEQTLPDIQSAEHAVEMIKNISSNQSQQPFFLALGFYKPHIPFKIPQEFLDLYPLDEIELAPHPTIPRYLPLVAFAPWRQLYRREDFNSLNVSFPFGSVPIHFQKKIRQHYFASVSYIDSLVGKVLNELENSGLAENTIISVVSDHGWSLGDNGEWGKCANFEVQTRVPLIVHVPHSISHMAAPSTARLFPLIDVFQNENLQFPRGTTSDSLVELVDLFPTLSELASLDVPPTCPHHPFNVDFCTEGASFAPQLMNAMRRRMDADDVDERCVCNGGGKSAVFSQYPRPSSYPQHDSQLPRLENIKIMGYSMTTRHYRYTEWVEFDPNTFTANYTQVYARELYLRDSDPLEVHNVADFPLYHHLVEKLRRKLIAGWRSALPK